MIHKSNLLMKMSNKSTVLHYEIDICISVYPKLTKLSPAGGVVLVSCYDHV